MFLANDQHQLLYFTGPDRDHQTPTGCQLIEQRLRYIRRDRRHDNAVVRRQRRPPFSTIAPAKHHVAQIQLDQAFLGPVLQHLDALDGKHSLNQLR